MMKIKTASFGTVLVLLLTAVFAVSILLVMQLSADAYRKIVEDDRQAYTSRTAVQYLHTKLRQGDAGGQIDAADDAIVLTQTIDGEAYSTYIYYHDGYIRELFVVGDGFVPENGTEIIAAQGFSARRHGNHIEMELIAADGTQQMTRYTLRSEGGSPDAQ